MSPHTSISPSKAADRLAIRELVEAYAHCAGAYRDVETALVSYANIKVRRNELAAESAADAQATEITKLLYERGVETFLPVLDSERSLCAADDALAQSERDSALAPISLYKSLGGGWPSASADISIGR
jgi:outer membrane protein, multidrug efflux system